MNQLILINTPLSMSGKQTLFTDPFQVLHSFHVPQLTVCDAAQSLTSAVYPQTMNTTP